MYNSVLKFSAVRIKSSENDSGVNFRVRLPKDTGKHHVSSIEHVTSSDTRE